MGYADPCGTEVGLLNRFCRTLGPAFGTPSTNLVPYFRLKLELSKPIQTTHKLTLNAEKEQGKRKAAFIFVIKVCQLSNSSSFEIINCDFQTESCHENSQMRKVFIQLTIAHNSRSQWQSGQEIICFVPLKH
jgi:hypothetical protein